jgi:NAD(P)-dependent dehydrogenase (short-subunit alcohol dehydrogenase family)
MTTSSSAAAGGRLQGRLALVTGASRGLGAAVAEAYAREGAHVVLLARTQGALEEVDDRIQAAGGTATLLPFDLSEHKKIPALGAALAERFGKLDILTACAATLGALSPVAMSDAKIYDEVMRVNFMANVHLLRSLDGLLRGSIAGRAIFVTDHTLGEHPPFWSAYRASKAALEAMAATYAHEVSFSPLRVNIVNPGRLRTGLRAAAFPGENPAELTAPEDVTDIFVRLAAEDFTDTGRIVAAA